ncbi:MAG: ABC transporter ATP-binding protein [Desulfitobacteriaceae bacterium]
MDLEIENLNKSYDELIVFKDFGLKIPEGKIICILGPSGCGKTTLLNMIGGLVKADSGRFSGFENKLLSYIFQEPRLLKWKTVRENIEFVLKDIYPRNKRLEIVDQYLEQVELTTFRDYYPDNLSGGMKQRTAIARAFVYHSDILIMDEPFKGQDLKLKLSLINSFLKLWNKDKRTVIFVTHDIEEAVLLGDEIVVLGSLPARVLKKFTNNVLREERKLKDIRNHQMEREIYEMVIA